MGESAAEQKPGGHAALVADAVIAGKYRLVNELGAGAMGTVWSATHQTLGHQVAIKFLVASITASDEGRARFDREARLAARLGEASRHITRVIDHGVTEDRVPYLVMELLRGEALSTFLKREKRISLQLAARIVQQLARALHVAHSAGVIHRDLKPANIFLCTPEQGEDVDVKLLDFGVAKATLEHDEDLSTVRGQIIGTPGYMSPEQVTCDRSIDARSDLWAVAAIVYKMVVGKSPFGRGPMQEIGLRILTTDPPPPSTLWPDLPVEFDRWIERGLAKKAEHRFHSARELADFLASVAGVTSGTSLAPAPSSGKLKIVADDEEEKRESPTMRATPSQGRHKETRRIAYRRGALAAAIAIAAALVVTAALPMRDNDKTAPAPAQVASSPIAVASPSFELAMRPPPAPSPIASVSAPPPPRPAPPQPPRPIAGKPPEPNPADNSGWGDKTQL